MLISNQLWQEYRDTLYRFILQRVKNPVFSEDIVQDVLSKAYSRLNTLKDQQKILPWLYQITRNTIINHYRRHQSTETIDKALMLKKAEIDEEVRRDLTGCILPLVKQLPDKYRQAVMLSEIDSLPQKEVAQRQKISLSGAKSRVQRGRQLLKTMIQQCCQPKLDRKGRIIDYQAKTECGICGSSEDQSACL